MHIPDGLINAPVAAAAGVVAVAGIGVCLYGAKRQLDEKTAPLAGLVAVFVFAMQMINFPVAAGTSGHLLGGALAAILVGPYAGALAVSVVIIVQGLVFADGGLSALGLNVINMAFVPAVVGWVVFSLLVRFLPRASASVLGASFVAGLVAVPASAAFFVAEYAIGGSGIYSITQVFAAMVGVHVLIGIGEGAITALTVGAVYGVRPDLVYGMRRYLPGPVLVDGAGALVSVRAAESPIAAHRSRRPWLFIAAGLAVSVVIAGVLSRFASSSPDGLERVGSDIGFIDHAQSSANAGSFLADYGSVGGIPVGLAGLIGVGIMAVIAFGLFVFLGRSKGNDERPAAAGHHHGHDVGERLYIHRHTPIHDLPAHVKVVTLVAFVFVVVATPVTQYWAFGVYALLLAAVAAMARIPATVILPRMLVEIPFVLFAVLMPFLGPDPKVSVLGISLSQAGLIAAWGILAKGTLGVIASILLAATTPARDLVMGLERLHVPQLLVQIASFMLRYAHVVSDESTRMRIARESRGFEARGPRAWPTLGRTVGALFIRSYERGERVHLAMLSRGYTGRMPVAGAAATMQDWTRAAALPVAAVIIAIVAVLVQS